MKKLKVNRRVFLGAALGGAASVAVVRYSNAPAVAAPPAPAPPPGVAPQDMVVPDENGGYMSHLLPFAPPVSTPAAAAQRVRQARQQGLFK